MKLLLCTLNSQYIHSSLSPWCLLAGVRAYAPAEIDAAVWEGTVNQPPEALLDRLLSQQPDAVFFSCYIWNITQVQRLLRGLRAALPRCFIAVGGPEVGYCPKETLTTCPYIDGVLSGEGEYPAARLAAALLGGEPLPGLPGLSCRVGEALCLSDPYLTNAEPPSPYCPAYFAALGGRIAYLETSRGCPFSCAFCLSGRCGSVRYFPLERAERELLLLANSGAGTVKLVDRTFNANPQRAKTLLAFLKSHAGTDIPRGVCFHFEIGADLLDEEALSLLTSLPPGLVQLEAGLQSFRPDTLDRVRRHTDLDRLCHNLHCLISAGNLHVHLDLIAGLPLETAADFAAGFDRAFFLEPHMLQLGFLKLLHGAAMREEPDVYPCHFDPQPPYCVTDTPWITGEELAALRPVEAALDTVYNSGRFRRTTAYLLTALSCTPFALFQRLGDILGTGCGRSLDQVCDLLYTRLRTLPQIGPEELRDAMVCDRLATNQSGRLSPALARPDPALRALRRQLERNPQTRAAPGVRRGTAVLYGKRQGVYADYDRPPHPVTGEYPLRFVSLPE